jgi:hypothetical protein
MLPATSWAMTLVKDIAITINLYQAYWGLPDLGGLLTPQQAATAGFVRANN